MHRYLAERYGAEQGFLPGTSDWAARTEVLAWLHFSESTMLASRFSAAVALTTS